MANEFIARNGIFALSNSQVTGSLSVTNGITGSLFGTSSFAVSASWAPVTTTAATASFVTSSNVYGPYGSNSILSASFAVSASRAVTSSFALTSSFAPLYLPLTGGTINGNVTVNGTASIAFLNVQYESASVIYSSGSNVFGDATNDTQTLNGTVLVSGSQQITGSLSVTGGIVGSLFGTASYATEALTASGIGPAIVNNTDNYVLTATGGSTIQGESNLTFDGTQLTQAGRFLQGGATSATGQNSHAEGRQTVASGDESHAEGESTVALGNYSHTEGRKTLASGISSHAEGYYTTASGDYQHVQGRYNITSSAQSAFIIGNGPTDGSRSNLVFASGSQFQVTGSLNVTGSTTIAGAAAIGTTSLGPSENTLTLGARDAVNEGGQLGFNAPGGTYTSASMIDLYQNRLRILRGTNASSTGEVATWNLHTLQMGLPAYTSTSAFPGTATAALAVDSGGNIITIATGSGGGGSGTVTSIGGTGTVSGITLTGTVTTSGSLVLGGAISGLTNSNLSGTAGITNANLANSAIQIGSTNMSLGMGYSNLLGLSLIQVTGSVIATQGITGSLFGTASFATTSSFALNAATASIAFSTPNAFILGGSPSIGYLQYANGNLTLTSSPIYYTGGNLGVNTTVPSANLDVNGTLRTSGSLYITGSTSHKGDTLFSGSIFVSSSAPTIGQLVSNQNGYAEFSVRNTNTGVSASGDIVVYADNGTVSNNYIDMGIHNSGMSPSYSYFGTDFGNALDGYLYNVGGNLRIGNATSVAPFSQSFFLFSNATATPNIWITGSQVGIGKSSGALNGTLDVNGSAIITGSLNVSAGITGSLFGTATTASTLATSRTLWGQSFNGSANVTGNLTSVGDITGTTDMVVSCPGRLQLYTTVSQPIRFFPNATQRWEMTPEGILSSTGAQTITTSTGNLKLASGAGNGKILLTPHGTGSVEITNGIFYSSSLSTANVSGEIAYWGGGTVAAGNLYYYDSSGNWTAADADSAGTSNGLLGIALAAGTASTVGILLRGNARFTGVTSFTGTTTIGALLYVSQTAGAFSQTPPTGTGTIVRVIGYVQSTANDQIYFCPDSTFIELT